MKMAAALLLLSLLSTASAGPQSIPYVPFRTSPFEQKVHHNLTFGGTLRSQITKYLPKGEDQQCPLQFTLGVSKRSHHHNHRHRSKGLALVNPPVIYPVYPSRGPGRQVMYTTLYEHLDLLTPASVAQLGLSSSSVIKEGLVQSEEFPLLFESSAFHASPIIHDVNGDGIADAILVDYDGGIYVVGLDSKRNERRYFHRAQVPRIFLRRNWMEARLNETLPKTEEVDSAGTNDPYHSYFEYNSQTTSDKILRGITANLMAQDNADLAGLEERRKRKVHHTKSKPPNADEHRDEKPSGSEDERFHQQEQVGAQKNIELDGQGENQELIRAQQNHEEQQAEGMQRQDATAHQQEPQTDERSNSQQNQNENQNAPKQEIVHDQQKNERQQGDVKANKNHDENHKAQGQEPEHNQQNQEERQQVANDGNEQQRQPHGNSNSQQAQGEKEEGDKDSNVQQEDALKEAEAQRNKIKEANPENEAVHRRRLEEVHELHHDDEFMAAHGVNDEGEQDHLGPGEHDETHHEDDEHWEEMRAGEGEHHVVDDDLVAAVDPYADEVDKDAFPHDDDYRLMMDDMMHDGDDEYPYDSSYHGYYDEKHYIRIAPHVLCDPVLVELPKPYGNSDELEDVLILAVSYFLDEDEYEGHFSYKRFENTDFGDETEMDRGMYLTNALMLYKFSGGGGSWGRQEQLDLSGDYSAPQNNSLVASVPLRVDETKMGAFALATPTVADVDGDGNMDIITCTSMGLVYLFDTQHMFMKDSWPIQLKGPIESRALVEDVVGDTNLEIFVVDTHGNLLCLNSKGEQLWHRDLAESLGESPGQLAGSSPMVLGDIDGDGILELVLLLCAGEPSKEVFYLVAVSCVTGKDLRNFPIAVDVKMSARAQTHHKFPQPLLVDLHADQSHWRTYLQRNGTAQRELEPKKSKIPPHGGSALGLHIVQPIGSDLYIVEAGSGCIQTVSIGDEVTSMVQADDVHGTNSLDLVVSTASGKTITLETPAVPFHPLNVWNGGQSRGRGGLGVTHGFTASQGIFVRDVSRQYKDIFGIYVPITFEIFDKSMKNEEAKRTYEVRLRDGTSSKRTVMRKVYNEPGVYTERVYIQYGPGYYTFTISLKTSHGMVYEDRFHLGYNVHFMDGFGVLLWLPLVVAAIPIAIFGRRKLSWDDNDFARDESGGNSSLGILGRVLPTSS